jgi:transcriptional regulator with PAS, ATPase and Fis domain
MSIIHFQSLQKNTFSDFQADRALSKTGGSESQAAKMLEISRPILLSKIKAYELG